MFIKINKTQAAKYLKEGESVAVCPSNLRLGSPWNPEALIDAWTIEPFNCIGCKGKDHFKHKFNNFLNHFMYYNCNAESGNKVAFYLYK